MRRSETFRWDPTGNQPRPGLRAGIPPQALPLAWRQLQDQPRRMRRYALDDIAQIHERIDLQVLAGLHQRTQDGGAVRRCFAPGEEPVLPSRRIADVLGKPEPLLRRLVLKERAPGGRRWEREDVRVAKCSGNSDYETKGN